MPTPEKILGAQADVIFHVIGQYDIVPAYLLFDYFLVAMEKELVADISGRLIIFSQSGNNVLKGLSLFICDKDDRVIMKIA
jgi:hypothetical protein